MYTHLTRDDRAVIANGLRSKESYAEIGERIQRGVATISREITRNSDPSGFYCADRAHHRAQQRRTTSRCGSRKIENNAGLARAIERRLHPLVSPEVIAQDAPVVHETIYAWIRRSRPELTRRLPRRGKRRRRYGSKRQGYQGWTRFVRSIWERPAAAEARSETRHFEGDTLRGKRENKVALLTHADRKSRLVIAQKIADEGCDAGHAAIAANPRLKNACSITYDRGGTFALWRMIERDTGATVYFADPHSPWQRGSNENANERLRRVYPKGTDFANVSTRHLNRTLWLMNHTKRKCLNWRTPCEVDGACCTSS
jgi:IS30 family transposase